MTVPPAGLPGDRLLRPFITYKRFFVEQEMAAEMRREIRVWGKKTVHEAAERAHGQDCGPR